MKSILALIMLFSLNAFAQQNTCNSAKMITGLRLGTALSHIGGSTTGAWVEIKGHLVAIGYDRDPSYSQVKYFDAGKVGTSRERIVVRSIYRGHYDFIQYYDFDLDECAVVAEGGTECRTVTSMVKNGSKANHRLLQYCPWYDGWF